MSEHSSGPFGDACRPALVVLGTLRASGLDSVICFCPGTDKRVHLTPSQGFRLLSLRFLLKRKNLMLKFQNYSSHSKHLIMACFLTLQTPLLQDLGSLFVPLALL